MGLNYHNLLGFDFASGSLDDVRQEILQLVSEKSCKVVVTPNVDHLLYLRESKSDELNIAYKNADLKICDSKVLSLIGRFFFGQNLIACPGANIVQSLLEDPEPSIKSILIFGPSPQDFSILETKFSRVALRFIEAPKSLVIDSSDWRDSLESVEKADWDLGLICVSFPKQEMFATSLQKRGAVNGTLICAGASVDFLTGRQQRAPLWLRQINLEWLYRGVSNPRRLGRRYLKGMAKLVLLVIQYKVFPKNVK
jgi:N-acetylglucosaminyldiphosphoundecaprenol N-acetyl-beta-D-mannosaminyltransferase